MKRGLRRAAAAATLAPVIATDATPATSFPSRSLRRLEKRRFRKSRGFANRPQIKRQRTLRRKVPTSTEGPFGEPLRTTGAMAEANPVRFSTKYQDSETRLVYYGYRYYQPQTGRWLNRDPIGEYGGHNLTGFAFNRAVNCVDRNGLDVLSSVVVAVSSTATGASAATLASAASSSAATVVGAASTSAVTVGAGSAGIGVGAAGAGAGISGLASTGVGAIVVLGGAAVVQYTHPELLDPIGDKIWGVKQPGPVSLPDFSRSPFAYPNQGWRYACQQFAVQAYCRLKAKRQCPKWIEYESKDKRQHGLLAAELIGGLPGGERISDTGYHAGVLTKTNVVFDNINPQGLLRPIWETINVVFAREVAQSGAGGWISFHTADQIGIGTIRVLDKPPISTPCD